MAIINKIINSIFNLSPGDEGYQPELNVFGERASGRRMQRGKPYLVGERGMELFVPDQSGTMMNNMNTKRALGGIGQATYGTPVYGGNKMENDPWTQKINGEDEDLTWLIR